MENFGTAVKKQENVELEVTIGIRDDESGWFELHDEESGGDEWYAEGEFEFDGMAVTAFEGVFALPQCIINKLKEMGFDTSNVD